ncbi:MAG: helix-turn-helix domain-containing protein [Chitinophagales bacterium]|nr:helix-turn-helix domain-containing protein [Sphingobacteriales bacterium]
MRYLVQKIREAREKQNLLIRQDAAHIEVDTGLMSKAERDEWNLSRDQIVKLSKFFNSSKEEYISRWLCDKVIEAVDNEPVAT